MPAWEAGMELGPYQLRVELGEGAAATVWLAMQTGPGGVRKKVALKLIKGKPQAAVYESVCREARLTARLQHPNIVDVLGAEVHDGSLMVSMEYVGGGTLRELLQRVKAAGLGFPQSVVVSLAVDILRGLARAHGQPGTRRPTVLHRDLKPENVLLDVTGRAKVADFGLAKLLGEATQTGTGEIKGTHRYVPPEVWMGSRDFRPRGDLFAVGCMLFELVTLRRLFEGGIKEIVHASRHRTAADEAKEVGEVAPDLAPVVEALLRRDPEARYQLAGPVIEDLLELRGSRGGVGDVGLFLDLLRARDAGTVGTGPRLAERLKSSADPRWAALVG